MYVYFFISFQFGIEKPNNYYFYLIIKNTEADVLQSIESKTISLKECREILNETDIDPNSITDSFICTSGLINDCFCDNVDGMLNFIPYNIWMISMLL